MCGKAVKCAIDALLLLVLTIQTLLLLTLVYRGYWEIPSWIVEFAFEKYGEKTLSVNVESIRLFPKKGLIIRGVDLKSSACVCPLVSVEKILLVPSDPMIGRSESAVGMIENAVLYFPDPYLPEANNLKLIEGISLRFELNRTLLTLDSVKARISNLAITSLNKLEIDTHLFSSMGRRDQQKSPEEIYEKLREIRFLHEYFADAEEALLTFTFNKHSDRKYSTDISLYAASTLMVDRVATSGIYLDSRLVWDETFYVDGVVRGEIESLRFEDEVKFGHLALELSYERNDRYSILPDQVRVHSRELEVQGHPFEYLSATVHPTDLQNGMLEAEFGIGRKYVTTWAQYDLEHEVLDLRVRGDLDPIELATDWVGEFSGMSLLQFSGLPHVSGQLRIKHWKELQDVRFRLSTEQVSLSEVPFQYARTKGSWDPLTRTLILDEFVASQPNYTVRGRLLKCLSTTEYRYLIYGSGLPADLNPMFRPWWSHTWESFDFKTNPIACDLDIWGTLNDFSQRYLYGSIALDALEYRGLEIEYGQVRLNVISKYLDLFDLYIKHPEGIASGRIENIFGPEAGAGRVSQHLDLFTNIPLHLVAPLVGKQLDPIVENTEADAVADVWLKGVLIGEEYPEYGELDDLTIKIQVNQPTWLFGFQLDRVDALVRKQQEVIRVDPLSFQFASGAGSGLFEVAGFGDRKALEFTVTIEDFDFRKAIERIGGKKEEAIGDLPDLNAGAGGGGNQKGFKLKRPEDKSYMDLVLSGRCPIGDLGQLQAVGRFELDDPLIHRVHMFGGFSKVMDNAELNLGSFSLKRATSPIRVDGSMVYLDDLELTGPSSKVKSKGFFNIDSGELDFRLKAYPLGEVKFPVVAGLALVLRPFVHMFEIQLSGTLENPDWKLVIDPSGL